MFDSYVAIENIQRSASSASQDWMLALEPLFSFYAFREHFGSFLVCPVTPRVS